MRKKRSKLPFVAFVCPKCLKPIELKALDKHARLLRPPIEKEYWECVKCKTNWIHYPNLKEGESWIEIEVK